MHQPVTNSPLSHGFPLLSPLIDDLEEVIELKLSFRSFSDSLLILEFFNESQFVHFILVDKILLILELPILLDGPQDGLHVGVHDLVVLFHQFVDVYRILPSMHFAVEAKI